MQRREELRIKSRYRLKREQCGLLIEKICSEKHDVTIGLQGQFSR